MAWFSQSCGHMTFCHRLLILFFCFLLVGCLADPWPEPDPAEETDAPNSGGDADGDADADADSDSQSDTDDESGAWDSPPKESNIFCSAPGPDGLVTVVGLQDAVARGSEVLIRNIEGTEVIVPVGEDNGFTGRIASAETKYIYIFTMENDELSEPAVVLSGQTISGYVEEKIVGSGTLSAPDGEGQSVIHGDGEALESGLRIIGANISNSTGGESLISCTGGCQFVLFLPADPDDLVDLFLVPTAGNSGITNVQTITIP
jgi:hypothetical protein